MGLRMRWAWALNHARDVRLLISIKAPVGASRENNAHAKREDDAMVVIKRSVGLLLIMSALAVSACANGATSKSSVCAAYDTTRQATDYSARLVAPDGKASPDLFELQIQAVHPASMASRIKKITLNDGSAPKFRLLDDNCICGMKIKDVDVECTHITTYTADIFRKTLVGLQNKGLAMTFHLENNHIVAGPLISSSEINEVLSQ